MGGAHGGNAGRQGGRGQLLLFWLVIVLVFVLSFQFLAYEQTSSSGSSSQTFLQVDSQAQQAFEHMLGKFLLSPKNSSRGSSSNRDVRNLLEKLCATSKASGQRAEICDLMVDKKRMGALKKEVAGLHEIMENATILMDLKIDRTEDENTENEYHYFMSSLNVADRVGIRGEFEFPTKASLGRLVCLQINNPKEGTQNKYGFAWKEHLPANATLLPGLTLITNTNWEGDFENIYHGMHFIAPYASWRPKGGCAVPERLLLYSHGGVIVSMFSWMEHLLESIFGRKVPIQSLEEQLVARGKEANSLACFERAVVNRQWVSGDSETVYRIYETLRCRARRFCGVQHAPTASEGGASPVQISLVLRDGTRAFKDAPAVQRVIERVVQEHGNSRLEVAHSANLSFCEQVALFSKTDILLTTHGAQMTNMIFMPTNSSVIENMGYGWEEFGGQGQFVYAWLAARLKLHHEGYWYDPEGSPCPNPEDTRACFLFHKGGQVGHNETHLTEWTSTVLKRFAEVTPSSSVETLDDSCPCEREDREQRPGSS